jgi:hypothetical protein
MEVNGGPEFGYSTQEILSLRVVCTNVQKQPWSSDAAVMLIRLCSAVMAHHDALPGSQEAATWRAEMNALIGSLAPAVEASLTTTVSELLTNVGDRPQTG